MLQDMAMPDVAAHESLEQACPRERCLSIRLRAKIEAPAVENLKTNPAALNWARLEPPKSPQVSM